MELVPYTTMSPQERISIRMGSSASHFNVGALSKKECSQITTFEENGTGQKGTEPHAEDSGCCQAAMTRLTTADCKVGVLCLTCHFILDAIALCYQYRCSSVARSQTQYKNQLC